MGVLKSLTGQTAYYGLSSMGARLINYPLVFLWTNYFVDPDLLAPVHYLYACAAMLNVLLTYGMETAFFRFSSDPANNRKTVSDTAFTSLFISTTVWMVFGMLFFRQMAGWMDYSEQAACVFYFVLMVGLDTYSVIPFAQLRLDNRAARYALVRMAGVILTVLLNLLLIVVLPHYGVMGISVKSIFISNVVGSALVLVMLGREWRGYSLRLDKVLLKKMLSYGWPILIAGTAYAVNEVMDRVLLREWLPYDRLEQEKLLGIYGSCAKLAVFITLFVQAFRLAMEPFFFSHAKDRDARQTYATVTLYFTVAVTAMYVGIVGNLSWLQYLIGKEYREGVGVVPILMFSNIFLGLYYNMSMWYKLTDRTRWGAYISVAGAVVTILVLFYGVPRFGYMAAAWSHVAAYGVMMLSSYIFGQHYYPVPYRSGRIVAYMLLGWGCGYVSWYVLAGNVLAGNALFVLFCGAVFLVERKDFKRALS